MPRWPLASLASAARAENALVSGPILPALLRLTLPNLAAMLVVALVAIFETVYVGILGTTPLAAIALVFPLIMLMQMLSAGAMGGGVSSAISRALGAGDLARAEALALHAVVIGAAAGLAFSAIFVAFGAPILRMLGGSGAVLGEALVYANIALAGAILTWLVNTFASVLRGTGNMRVPSLTLLAASGLQIVLGGGLGLGIGPIPRFGLAGVATGLIVAYALAALFLFWFLRSGRGRLRLKFGAAALQREMFFDILKVGAVSSLGLVPGRAHGADSDPAGSRLRHGGAGRLRHRRTPGVPPHPDRLRGRRCQRADGGHGDGRSRHRARTAGGVDRRRRSRGHAGCDRARRDDCARPVVGTFHQRPPPSAPQPTCTCAGPAPGSYSLVWGSAFTLPRKAQARCLPRFSPGPSGSW